VFANKAGTTRNPPPSLVGRFLEFTAPMLTGEIRSQVDRIWNTFWAGGIANPRKDSKKRFFQDFRWNRFKNFDPRDMYTAVSEHVFPLAANAGRD